MDDSKPATEEVPKKLKRYDWASVLLGLSVVIALVFIIVLWKKNAQLKSDTTEFMKSFVEAQQARPGDIVPSFETVNVEGKVRQVTYDGLPKYLLFIFTPKCPACSEQFANWRHIAEQVSSKNCLPVFLSLDSPDKTIEFLKTTDITPSEVSDILILPSAAVQRAYRVERVPQIMVISRGGKVDWVYNGLLVNDKLTELLEKLNSR